MTYKELRDYLSLDLTPAQLELDVSILHNGEYYDNIWFGITSEADVLDENHPYLEIDPEGT
jgi:hypothetical protein